MPSFTRRTRPIRKNSTKSRSLTPFSPGLSKAQRIREVFRKRPSWQDAQIAKHLGQFGVTQTDVSVQRSRLKAQGTTFPKRVSKAQAIWGMIAQQPTLTPAQVVHALKEQGIRVTIGNVHNVRTRMRGKGTKIPKAKKTVPLNPRSKAGRVRAEILINPKLRNRAIADQLRRRHVRVTPKFVGSVRRAMLRTRLISTETVHVPEAERIRAALREHSTWDPVQIAYSLKEFGVTPDNVRDVKSRGTEFPKTEKVQLSIISHAEAEALRIRQWTEALRRKRLQH